MSERRTLAPGRFVLLAVVAVALAVVVGLVVWRPFGDPTPRDAAAPPADPSAADPAPRSRVDRATTLRARPTCQRVRHGFTPRSISIPGVTSAAGVVTPPRDANDVPGTPPLTTAGKSLFAWDVAQGTRPGDRAGNVLLNAHAWPDGSALGDRMVAQLQRGDRIVVRGEDHRLCYRVTERVQVLAADGLPRYYDRHGKPRLALLTCSGRRLGPGVWTHRTIWFASPVT